MTPQPTEFQGQISTTRFHLDQQQPILDLLVNIPLLPATPLFALNAEPGALAWKCTRSEFTPDTAAFTWTSGPEPEWTLEARWTFDPANDLWRCAHTIRRTGQQPGRIFDAAVRFSLPPAPWSAYAQHSAWCNENQGAWHPLDGGTWILDSNGGRTTQTHTPYLFLRDAESGRALAWHLIPNGNWFIRIRSPLPSHFNTAHRPITLDLGLGDRDFRPVLEPGQTLALPELLIQAAPGADPESAAVPLHRHLRTHHLKPLPREVPAVYNTWFDAFDALEVPRLQRQLAVARELGFEVFTVDAGWYGGAIDQPWHLLVGHWEEKQSAAFHGRMREFADQVRAAGLGFGLWMEPERFGSGAPIRAQHPDWFVDAGGGYAHIDLTRPAAAAWLRTEIDRLVDTYRLAWMKIDFNFELGPDPHRRAHAGYFETWHRLLADLSARHPETIFEACASGGMRMDLAMARLHPFHFLSDTVNPVDVLRIYQGALLRLPPGRIGLWTVLRSIGATLPDYGRPLAEARPKIVAPGGAGWDSIEIVQPDFALRVACLGMFGMSGDLIDLPPAVRERIRLHLDFFKAWRRFIHSAEVTPLTPARPKSDRSGWLAFHLRHPDHPRQSLLFVFRLDDPRTEHTWRLFDLDPDARYTFRAFDAPETDASIESGSALRQAGRVVSLPAPRSAGIYILSRVDR